jgi:hypothetical protein
MPRERQNCPFDLSTVLGLQAQLLARKGKAWSQQVAPKQAPAAKKANLRNPPLPSKPAKKANDGSEAEKGKPPTAHEDAEQPADSAGPGTPSKGEDKAAAIRAASSSPGLSEDITASVGGPPTEAELENEVQSAAPTVARPRREGCADAAAAAAHDGNVTPVKRALQAILPGALTVPCPHSCFDILAAVNISQRRAVQALIAAA